MALLSKESIPNLLLKNVPQDLLLAIQDALTVGAQRGYQTSLGMDKGHIPHVVGQMRHFHMNESFHRALTVAEAAPSPIRGNGIVTGQSGLFTLARFNIPSGMWNNGRRSACRRQMSEANKALEPLVHYDLFADYERPSCATAFFVASFPKFSTNSDINLPTSIDIAVPDSNMHGWLFKEPIAKFIKRYEEVTVSQIDLAQPKLKKHIGKQKTDGTHS
jgi:hypothetical protein